MYVSISFFISVLEYRCLYLSLCIFVYISVLVCLCRPFLAVLTCLYGIHASFLLDTGSRFWHVKICVFSPTIALRMQNIDMRIRSSVGAPAPLGWRPWRPLLPATLRVLASIIGKCLPAMSTWCTLARASAHPEYLPSAQNTFHTCLYALPTRAAHAHSFRPVWRPPFRVAKASNAARIQLGNAFQYNSFNSSNFSKISIALDSPRLGHVERAQKR